MTTLSDMQQALTAAQMIKNEKQAALRKAATELVREYRDSLEIDPHDTTEHVYTGELKGGCYEKKPVIAIELDQDKALRFVLTTVVSNRVVNKFVISVSLTMREQDGTIAVLVGDDPLPVIALQEGSEGRFYETAEKIKAEILRKIENLA